MRDRKKTEQPYKQTANCCIYAAYALAMSDALNRSVSDFFAAYAAHFRLPGNTEQDFQNHFHSYFQTQGLLGFQVVEDLHNNSSEPLFQSAKAAAKLTVHKHVPTVAASIDSTISHSDAVVCVSENQGAHGVVVGCDKSGFYKVDPNGANAAAQITSLASGGITQPADALLIEFV